MTGRVTFVGAGPGDPRLLTLRAASALEEADWVLFDPGIHPDVLSRVREGTPRHPVTPQLSPDRIGQLLAERAQQGDAVVRLTWGDPLLFGPSESEAAVVAKAGVALEIVPGIDPLAAVGAFAGVPLTHAGDVTPSVAFVRVSSGLESLHDWQKLATATDTIALVCDPGSVEEVGRNLVFYGRKGTEPVTVVENITLPTQRTRETRLAELPILARSASTHVIVVVGERAAPLHALTWVERLPLFGKRVLVTRAREQAGRTAERLRERGADPVVVPTIDIRPPSDPAPTVDAVTTLGSYGWVVFTSANGVERVGSELRRQGRDARAFGTAKIAAIGPGTAAALERLGLVADLVPSVHKGEDLAAELVRVIGSSAPRVLVARAERARDVVPDALRQVGCTVDVVPVYKTCPPPQPLLDGLAALLEAGEIDAVTFTSSSTVEHLCDALEDRAAMLLARTRVASIGPITTSTAQKRGVRVDVTAREHTIEGLVRALEGFFDLGSTGTRPSLRR